MTPEELNKEFSSYIRWLPVKAMEWTRPEPRPISIKQRQINGIAVELSALVPENEIRIVQNHLTVGRIINIGSPD